MVPSGECLAAMHAGTVGAACHYGNRRRAVDMPAERMYHAVVYQS
jgi:hypothetical protein